MKHIPYATRTRSSATLGIIAAVVTALAAGTASIAATPSNRDTQAGPDERRPAQRENLSPDQRRPQPLALFDTDHDGTISAAEIDAAPEVLRGLDRDGDGKLSGRELRPARPDRPDGPPPGDGEDDQAGQDRGGKRPRPPRPESE